MPSGLHPLGLLQSFTNKSPQYQGAGGNAKAVSQDPFAYMNQKVADRAMLLSEEEQLSGDVLVSVETQENEAPDSRFYSWIQTNFADFLKFIRYLRKEDQELLLAYYLLGKPQAQLAKFCGITQTQVSQKIRMAIKNLGTYLMLGVPTVERMRKILTTAGLEEPAPGVSLAVLVFEYAEVGSFEAVAWKYRLYRPDVRRWLGRANKQLLVSTEPEQQALGAYIFNLIDKKDAKGPGWTARQRQKMPRLLERKGPALLGQFRIKVDDPDFERHCFASRAER